MAKPYETLAVSINTSDLVEFKAKVKQAKEMGATHVFIHALRDRTDYRGENKGSPWTEWNIGFASIFKHATPPVLKDLYPAAWQKRQMAFMKAKHDIVAREGLRCAYHGLEPHWISERIYEMHPEWRGCRCDNSLRTCGMFFSPNTDHPEVQQAYRDAMKMIVKACPKLDLFTFHTNDCGSGYSWSNKLYVNPNGPSFGPGSFGGDQGKRIADFLRTLRAGAKDGGVDAWIYVAPFMLTHDERHLLSKQLEPGIGVAWNGDYVETDPAYRLSTAGDTGDYLGLGVDSPWSVINAVARMKTGRARAFEAPNLTDSFRTAFTVAMNEPPAQTEQDRMGVALKIAEAMYGKEVANQVVDGWYALKEIVAAEQAIRPPYFCAIALRWLVRPLVAYQNMLTPEERSYWEPYIYQSRESQPETYLDYLNTTGRNCVSSWEHVAQICAPLYGVVDGYKGVAARFEAAAKAAKTSQARRALEICALKLRAKACIAFTVHNVIQVGQLIIERDKAPKLTSVDPAPVPQSNDGNMGSPELFMMARALRWELDNTNELIRLMEKSPVPLLHHVKDKALEGALVYGPDVLANLKKKVRLMIKYWRSAETGFYRSTKGG